MDAKELRAKSPEELSKELSELLRAHFGLRMQHATQQLANTSELRKTRRSIARVRTVMREQAGNTAQTVKAPTTRAKKS